MKDKPIFNLLWQMVNEIDKARDREIMRDSTGTIISRYASMIDDRLENSGNSQSVDSLKLYDTYQLKDEIASRKSKS